MFRCLASLLLTLAAAKRRHALVQLAAFARQDLAVSEEHRSGEKTAIVIVRSHQPSKAMKTRILAIAEDVMQRMPSAHMLLSIDDSGLNATQRWLPPLPEANLHRYNISDVEDRFPNVAWGKLCAVDGSCANGKTFHTEPIMAAVAYAIQHVRVAGDAFVWVLEDDVLVCGSFSQIAAAYAKDRSDFLAGAVYNVSAWTFTEFATEAFKARYNVTKRLQGPEFVVRLSIPFLAHLAELAQEGVEAQSEMLAPTVCKNDGYSCGLFSRKHVNVASFVWDLRLDPAEQALICEIDPLTMHHAAKVF